MQNDKCKMENASRECVTVKRSSSISPRAGGGGQAATKKAIQDALRLAAAWRDLDWEDMERGLDRIRHESPPSPPLAL
jgi:hypothetical protein